MFDQKVEESVPQFQNEINENRAQKNVRYADFTRVDRESPLKLFRGGKETKIRRVIFFLSLPPPVMSEGDEGERLRGNRDDGGRGMKD